jgi:hypothetical protein
MVISVRVLTSSTSEFKMMVAGSAGFPPLVIPLVVQDN